MTRIYSYSNNKKRGGALKQRTKEADIFQDKWAPTPQEMKKAERAVCNSQTQSSVLQGKPRKAQHVINNENKPNAARKLGKPTGKIIYATPLPNPRITHNNKKTKKAVLYANAIPFQTIQKPTSGKELVTKKRAEPTHPFPQTKTPSSQKKKYAEPIRPLPETILSPKEATAGKTSTKSSKLWSTLDYYISLPKQGEEEVKQQGEESKSSSILSLPPPPPRRKNPFAEDEKMDAPYDEDANSISSSANSIEAAATKTETKPWGKENQKKEKTLRRLFSKKRVEEGNEAPSPPRRKNPFAEDETAEAENRPLSNKKVHDTSDHGPVSLDEFVPVVAIKVNSDQPIGDPNRTSLGGKLKKSLLPRRQKQKARNQVTEPPKPTHEHERQKPNAKPLTEFGTNDRLQQRNHRVQVDGNNRKNTIMTMNDTKTSPMRPNPVKREKSNGEEANEAVEVMDLTTMSLESFQLSFLENSNVCLTDVYEIDYPVHKSIVSGTLSIALPQDVFLLVSTQLSLLDEYIVRNKLKKTPQGDRLLVDSILSMLKNISEKQTKYRDSYLQDSLEGCIAAANSFMWMVEKVEEFMELVATKYPHLCWCDTDPVTWMPCQEAKELSSQFSHDAVLAASTEAVCFIMDDAHDAGLFSLLFSRQWEEELVHNEVSVSMTRILERRISMASKWLEQDYLFHKFVGALVRATICFYMEGIVHKAERLRSAGSTLGKKTARKKVAFRNPQKACGRLSDDIAVLQDYFEDIAEQNIALARVISKEFSFLSLLVECMLQAGKSHTDDVDIAEFVYAMHKETGANFDVTKFFMSDVFLLVGPKGAHHRVEAFINGMHEELGIFTLEDLKTVAMANSDMNGFKLHEVMLSLYEERIKNDRTYIAMAEGAIKQTKRDIKKELKNTELRVQYFLEDLHEELAATVGSRPQLGEF